MSQSSQRKIPKKNEKKNSKSVSDRFFHSLWVQLMASQKNGHLLRAPGDYWRHYLIASVVSYHLLKVLTQSPEGRCSLPDTVFFFFIQSMDSSTALFISCWTIPFKLCMRIHTWYILTCISSKFMSINHMQYCLLLAFKASLVFFIHSPSFPLYDPTFSLLIKSPVITRFPFSLHYLCESTQNSL